MTLGDALKTAVENLSTHKLRSVLTMLGMIFGVGAVIAMLSIGEGAEREAMEMIERLGVHEVRVGPVGVEERHLAPLGAHSAELLAGAERLVDDVAVLVTLEQETVVINGLAMLVEDVHLLMAHGGASTAHTDTDVAFLGNACRKVAERIAWADQIELAVLVDRGHRELPIQADYKGVTKTTEREDMINVLVAEHDGQDIVYIEQG